MCEMPFITPASLGITLKYADLANVSSILDRPTREEALSSLQAYLCCGRTFTSLDLLKIWKGLFFCMPPSLTLPLVPKSIFLPKSKPLIYNLTQACSIPTVPSPNNVSRRLSPPSFFPFLPRSLFPTFTPSGPL